MFTLLLLAVWFVFGVHDGVLTGALLVCYPLFSFMGAVAGTTITRSLFGRSESGEADFEALGTIMGGGLASLIAATVACLAEIPEWGFATATACSIAAMVIWYRLVCLSRPPETRIVFVHSNCTKCGSRQLITYYNCDSPPRCRECGWEIHPSADELRTAPSSERKHTQMLAKIRDHGVDAPNGHQQFPRLFWLSDITKCSQR